MIEHIEASVVLFKIRQVCLQSASTAKIMATPLPELMEQMMADSPYLQTLEWLVNKFWDDETRQTPIDGTPLVDPDGMLWTREAFGDELSDSEYRLAERLYALAEWASQILYHEDFDLRLIIADYEPQYGATEFVSENTQLQQWVRETPLRRLAAVATQMVYRHAITKVTEENQAIQDYLAESCNDAGTDWFDVEICEKYIKKVWDALKEVADHCAKARSLGLSVEEQHVADMLWGWVPHNFDEELVAASREICRTAAEQLEKEPMIRSDIGENNYIKKVMPEVERLCQKHDVYFDSNDGYSLQRGYLLWWLKDKYWQGRRLEE